MAVSWKVFALVFVGLAVCYLQHCNAASDDEDPSYAAYQQQMIELVRQLQEEERALGLVDEQLTQHGVLDLHEEGHDSSSGSNSSDSLSSASSGSSSSANNSTAPDSESSSSSSDSSSDGDNSHAVTKADIDTTGKDMASGLRDTTVEKPSFPCPPLAPSPRPPKSVHRLRPSDIKVIGAMGDSLTAGRGAGGKHFMAMLYDYRGLSWSAGGDGSYADFPSLPNILREFNPHLYGFSNGRDWDDAGFNMAVTASTSNNLDKQARHLIHKMKKDPNVNVKTDWKVITIFIGANDVCRACYDWTLNAENFKNNLRDALTRLHDELPRTFVNLVEVMKMEMAPEMVEQNSLCATTLSALCNCLAYPKDQFAQQKNLKRRMAFQKAAEDLVNSGMFDDQDDFAVVLQPFYKNSGPPPKKSIIDEAAEDELRPTLLPKYDIDLSYFAADCFHYSRKGQASAGINLYNNMMQPVGKKMIEWSPNPTLLCPDPDFPYLATKNNSQEMHHRMLQPWETAMDSQDAAVVIGEKETDTGNVEDGKDAEDMPDRETTAAIIDPTPPGQESDETDGGAGRDGAGRDHSHKHTGAAIVYAAVMCAGLGVAAVALGVTFLVKRARTTSGLYTRIP